MSRFDTPEFDNLLKEAAARLDELENEKNNIPLKYLRVGDKVFTSKSLIESQRFGTGYAWWQIDCLKKNKSFVFDGTIVVSQIADTIDEIVDCVVEVFPNRTKRKPAVTFRIYQKYEDGVWSDAFGNPLPSGCAINYGILTDKAIKFIATRKPDGSIELFEEDLT